MLAAGNSNHAVRAAVRVSVTRSGAGVARDRTLQAARNLNPYRQREPGIHNAAAARAGLAAAAHAARAVRPLMIGVIASYGELPALAAIDDS